MHPAEWSPKRSHIVRYGLSCGLEDQNRRRRQSPRIRIRPVGLRGFSRCRFRWATDALIFIFAWATTKLVWDLAGDQNERNGTRVRRQPFVSVHHPLTYSFHRSGSNLGRVGPQRVAGVEVNTCQTRMHVHGHSGTGVPTSVRWRQLRRVLDPHPKYRVWER